MKENYRKLTAEEIKDISFQILLDVSKYCDEHGIRYFLACGTLLGAIRHKGFIPWDDDIDIMMPRPDYKRFIEEYDSPLYSVYKPELGLLSYAKVYANNTVKYEPGTDYKKYKPYGVDIDVFPLDGIVNDQKIVDRMYKIECFLEMLLRLSNQPIFMRKNPLKAINRIIPRIIGSKNIVKLIERHCQRYDYDESDYVVRMKRSLNGFTGALQKEVYDKDYKEFEGHTFCVPKGYDKWLTAFFGDYMKLPPEEKQAPSHPADTYILEDKNEDNN